MEATVCTTRFEECMAKHHELIALADRLEENAEPPLDVTSVSEAIGDMLDQFDRSRDAGVIPIVR